MAMKKVQVEVISVRHKHECYSVPASVLVGAVLYRLRERIDQRCKARHEGKDNIKRAEVASVLKSMGLARFMPDRDKSE